MNFEDKRSTQRVDSQNLLYFTCCDPDGNVTAQGMGHTSNVSEGGILLETHISLATEVDLSITIALEEDIMEFKGRIVHHRKREDGWFESGVRFSEMDGERRRFLGQYVILFKEQEVKDYPLSDEDISFS